MKNVRVLGQIMSPNLVGYIVYEEDTNHVQMVDIATLKNIVKSRKLVNVELKNGELKGTECDLSRLCKYDGMGSPLENCITVLGKTKHYGSVFYRVVDESFNVREISEELLYNLKVNGYKLSNAKVVCRADIKGKNIIVSAIKGSFAETDADGIVVKSGDIVKGGNIEKRVNNIKPIHYTSSKYKEEIEIDESKLPYYLLSTVNKKDKVFISTEKYAYIETVLPKVTKGSFKSKSVCKNLKDKDITFYYNVLKGEFDSDLNFQLAAERINKTVHLLDLETAQNDWKLTDENYIGIIKVDSQEYYEKVLSEICSKVDSLYRLKDSELSNVSDGYRDIIYFEKGKIKGIIYLVCGSSISISCGEIENILGYGMCAGYEYALKFNMLEIKGIDVLNLDEFVSSIFGETGIKNVKINGKKYKGV